MLAWVAKKPETDKPWPIHVYFSLQSQSNEDWAATFSYAFETHGLRDQSPGAMIRMKSIRPCGKGIACPHQKKDVEWRLRRNKLKPEVARWNLKPQQKSAKDFRRDADSGQKWDKNFGYYLWFSGKMGAQLSSCPLHIQDHKSPG